MLRRIRLVAAVALTLVLVLAIFAPVSVPTPLGPTGAPAAQAQEITRTIYGARKNTTYIALFS